MPSSRARRAIAAIGVMPMPPAMKISRRADSSRRKWLRGALTCSRSPGRTAPCIQAEPPRLSVSRSTAISNALASAGSPHSEYWRDRPVSPHSTSMCEPGVQRGRSRPSGETRRSRTMPSAAGATRSTAIVRAMSRFDGSPMRTGELFSSTAGVVRSGIPRRVPFDPQVLGAAERGVGDVAEALLGQPQVRQAARQLLRGRPGSPCAPGSCPCTGASRSRR